MHYAAREASGLRVGHVTGVEAAMEPPYAGIDQLRAPMLPRLDAASALILALRRATAAGGIGGDGGRRPLDDRVRDRLVAETRGPLALLDLPRRVGAGGMTGGFEVLAVTDLPRQLENRYLERATGRERSARALPASTRAMTRR